MGLNDPLPFQKYYLEQHASASAQHWLSEQSVHSPLVHSSEVHSEQLADDFSVQQASFALQHSASGVQQEALPDD